MASQKLAEGKIASVINLQVLTLMSLAHVLMWGVFITGFIKDLVSLPRPLSPPLHRINMSGSAALEYGFPSTHSANAVSVAVLLLLNMSSPTSTVDPVTRPYLQFLCWGYMISIAFGRLYCGMHGFFDVIIGSLIGAAISLVEFYHGPSFMHLMHNGPWFGPLIYAIVLCVLVRVHPEPADDCPCFDDSVAVAGVLVGLELGQSHFSQHPLAWSFPNTATVPFDVGHLGWLTTILRVVIGVATVFAWREVMKPTLLKSLPHLFRFLEKNALVLPRKFFMPASEYKKIPSRQKLDNIMPSVSDLPAFITSIRHPGRGRAVSVGPQSAADAYETLAYRDKRRRDSKSGTTPVFTPRASSPTGKEKKDYFSLSTGSAAHTTQASVSSYEQMMGSGHVLFTPAIPGTRRSTAAHTDGESAIVDEQQEEAAAEKEMFRQLEKPRRRYDVEVVTKLVVYSGKHSFRLRSIHMVFLCVLTVLITGIAWLAVEGNPLIFEAIGMGMSGFVPDFAEQ